MKKQPKTNGGAGLLSRLKVCKNVINRTKTPCLLVKPLSYRRFCTVPSMLIVFSFSAFGQLSVIGGSGPAFPPKVDSIGFFVKFEKAKKKPDSVFMPLDTAFYGELRRNIDSTIHYVDAVRTKRREIGGATKGMKFDAFLRFTYANTPVMKVLFCGKRFDGALLDVKMDKYPFVVTFKPQFAHRLDSLASSLRKRPVRR